jgi:hypothetical protein
MNAACKCVIMFSMFLQYLCNLQCYILSTTQEKYCNVDCHGVVSLWTGKHPATEYIQGNNRRIAVSMQ